MKNIVIPFCVIVVLIIIVFLMFGGLETFFTESLTSLRDSKGMFAMVSSLILVSDVVLPVPSTIVMYTNGYVLGFLNGSLVSQLSLVAGSIFAYFLGKLTSMGISEKGNATANNFIMKYGASAILVTRGIPIISETVCIVSGYNRMPFGSYLLLNVIGYLPLSLIYAFCGSLGYGQNMFFLSLFISLLIALVFWVFGKIGAKK